MCSYVCECESMCVCMCSYMCACICVYLCIGVLVCMRKAACMHALHVCVPLAFFTVIRDTLIIIIRVVLIWSEILNTK